MAYNLEKKIKEFEFERKQVLHHLALLDANIATLKRAIDLMQQENDITLYNTQNFVYRRKFKLFKGKIRKYLVQILRNEPSKGFTIADLTQRIFEIEQNQDTPTEKHLDSVRKQLNEFYQRNWLTRTQISRREVLWQWKLK
ncbi:hypothetical protein E4T80_05360 [Muribacter muris]|uniref:DNA repair protein n=1 Tax=Muribacter muris TaxID=67855 RepID=A0A4Y9K1D5_9PAST|nr:MULTISPECIES: hypothetical protein [Pasteurellaceae]MBF0784899.1 hypothetical protein [Muribacter muris]MBF0826518.1 hypothetical protein [Muribacter muris]MCX2961937.1 hypothetical protein [Rodentibacter heylii]TFV10969.1 hypothetical protein E4T80_05360 [Muribacter muris]